MIGALLHDTLEDSLDKKQTEADIRAAFGFHMVVLVKAVSKQDGETYLQYVARTTLNPDSLLIKACDIEDHLDIDRLHETLDFQTVTGIVREHKSLFERYGKARKIIELLEKP